MQFTYKVITTHEWPQSKLALEGCILYHTSCAIHFWNSSFIWIRIRILFDKYEYVIILEYICMHQVYEYNIVITRNYYCCHKYYLYPIDYIHIWNCLTFYIYLDPQLSINAEHYWGPEIWYFKKYKNMQLRI